MASQGAAIIEFPTKDTSVPSVASATVASSASATGGDGPAAPQIQTLGHAAVERLFQLLTIQNLGQGRVLVQPLYISVEQAGARNAGRVAPASGSS